jgi:hypothetical protein
MLSSITCSLEAIIEVKEGDRRKKMMGEGKRWRKKKRKERLQPNTMLIHQLTLPR